MTNEPQIRVEGDHTGVSRWQWPLIGAILFAVVIAVVFLIASFWS